MSHIDTVLAVVFTGGGFYFLTNHRLTALEKKMELQKYLKDTIVRLDERVQLLINHFIKEK